jgi:hypothetical protein
MPAPWGGAGGWDTGELANSPFPCPKFLDVHSLRKRVSSPTATCSVANSRPPLSVQRSPRSGVAAKHRPLAGSRRGLPRLANWAGQAVGWKARPFAASCFPLREFPPVSGQGLTCWRGGRVGDVDCLCFPHLTPCPVKPSWRVRGRIRCGQGDYGAGFAITVQLVSGWNEPQLFPPAGWPGRAENCGVALAPVLEW